MIVGDANLAEVATFLKVGTTALVLSMIEDDWLTRDLLPAKPVQALRHVSYDITLARPIELADGSSITALEAQWELYDRARKFAEEHGLDVHRRRGRRPRGARAAGRRCSPGSRPTRSTLAGQVDWIAKHRLHRRLPRAPRPPLGRRPPGRHGPPVPRPPAGEVAGRPGRPRADRHRRGDRPGP